MNGKVTSLMKNRESPIIVECAFLLTLVFIVVAVLVAVLSVEVGQLSDAATTLLSSMS